MDPIQAGVGRARRQMAAQVYVSAVTRGILAGVILILLYIVIDRLIFVGLNPLPVAALLMGLPVLASLAIATFRLPGRQEASVALDLRFDLKERVSTSVALEGDDSAVAEAVRADARRHLKGKEIGKGLPVTFPGELLWLGAVLLILAVVANPKIFRYYDLLHRLEAKEALEKEQARVKLQAASLLEKREKLKKKFEGKKLAKVDEALKEWERVALDLQKNPGNRRSALVKMSKLGDTIREKQKSGKFKSVEGMSKALRTRFGSSGVMQEIRMALKKGDMRAAAAALDALQKKLEAGEISPEMMEKLKAEMKSLSLDLGAVPELAKSLEEAAMDLIDEDLQSALQDLEEAEMTLEDLAEAMEEFALLEEALKGLEGQKRNLFLDEDELAALEAEICEDCGGTMEEAWNDLDLGMLPGGLEGDCGSCKGKGGDCGDCGGTGKAHPGGKAGGKKSKSVCRRCLLAKLRQQQGGMGGPGRGRGGQTPDEPDLPVDYEKVKVKGRMGKGRIVGELFVKGPQVKGEVTEDYGEVIGEARQEAADALSKQKIPQGYRDFIREYFNSLDPEGDE